MSSYFAENLEAICNENLKAIYDKVYTSVLSENPDELNRIQQKVRDLFLSDADADAKVKNTIDSFLRLIRNLSDKKYIDTNQILDEQIMEKLTGAWLGLYFLGFSFPQPWEMVRRMSDLNGGGIPSDVVLRKSIGDVYRTARLMHRREYNTVPCSNLSETGNKVICPEIQPDRYMRVLADSPLVLDKSLLASENKQKSTIYKLALSYALLQLRLYVNSGYPISYFVKRAVLCKFSEQAGEVEKWLKTIFKTPSAYQKVIVVEDKNSKGLPECWVLGPKTAVYSVGASQMSEQIPFVGNYIRKPLLTAYHAKLIALEDTERSSDNFLNLLDKMLDEGEGWTNNVFPPKSMDSDSNTAALK